MKKIITVLIFLLSITGFSRNGVWEIVSEKSNPKVRVILLGDNEKLMKTGDSEFGIFIYYSGSYISMGDLSDLNIVESKYDISDLKPDEAKVRYPKANLKSSLVIGAVSKNYEHALKVQFYMDLDKDVKMYDKGNKTIVNYKDLYIVFDKGDAEIQSASGAN